MFKLSVVRQPLLVLLAVFAFSPFNTANAGKPAPAPSLATSLANLVTQGNAVDAQLAGITLTSTNSCTELGSASTSVRNWLTATQTVYAGITTALTIDTATLTSLDDLSNLSVSVANRTKTLSQSLTTLETTTDLFEYEASLAAMLRLSNDIGSMADRVGEMADRILVMGNNIGIMADRILITQQLQNSNVVLTQNSILTTQQNMVALSDTVDTLTYNTPFAALITQANSLSASMAVVLLTQTNMASELARIEPLVTSYLNNVVNLYTRVAQDSAFASQYINGDTLTMAGDLSGINRALAASLASYADAINRLAPQTSPTVLSSAIASMLRLTRDIGTMSNRTIEMVDRIIVMADNIGIMSTRIVDTQNLQQTNIDYTLASLLTATTVSVNTIKSYGL
jgi:hypothetical protein